MQRSLARILRAASALRTGLLEILMEACGRLLRQRTSPRSRARPLRAQGSWWSRHAKCIRRRVTWLGEFAGDHDCLDRNHSNSPTSSNSLAAVNPTPEHQRPPAKRVRSMNRSGPSPVRRRRTHRAESRRRVCCHSVGPTLAAVRFAPALPATTQFASVYAWSQRCREVRTQDARSATRPRRAFPASFSSVAPAYFLAGRGIGLTPTCSSAVYGAP